MAYPGDRPELFPQPSLDDLIGEAREILAKAKERFKPVATFALFSGGNDSTVMFELIHNEIDAAIHIDTGIGIIDKGRTALDHVRRRCEAKDVPLIVLTTDPGVYAGIVLDDSNDGFPGNHAICYHRLKQVRFKGLQEAHSSNGQKILLVSGIRKYESERRRRRFMKKKEFDNDHDARRCWYVNPILRFSNKNMLDMRQHLGVPMCEGSALLHKSGECLCGSFEQPFTLDELTFWFPKTGRYIQELQREAAARGKRYCQWGQGLSNQPSPGPLCSSCELFKHMGESDVPKV